MVTLSPRLVCVVATAQRDADALGYRNVPEFISTFARAGMANTPDGYKNLLAWYALEAVAMRETS